MNKIKDEFNANIIEDNERHIFNIVIEDKIMEVYNRPFKNHDLGKLNNCPDTWWLRMQNPIYDETKEVDTITGYRYNWIPYIDLGCNRPAWEVTFKQGNRIKYKYDDFHISGYGNMRITCNKVVVYEQCFNDLNWAMAKTQVVMMELMETIPNIFNIIGEKVWFQKQPGIITKLHNGNVTIKYDGENKEFDLTYPGDNNDFLYDAHDNHDNVVTHILDKNIRWCRP